METLVGNKKLVKEFREFSKCARIMKLKTLGKKKLDHRENKRLIEPREGAETDGALRKLNRKRKKPRFFDG